MSKLINQLLKHEGNSLVPYLCTKKKWTIGVGRNLDDVGLSAEERVYIGFHGDSYADLELTNLEAEYLLANDIEQCKTYINKLYFPLVKLTECRQAALIGMGFMGIGSLCKFTELKKALIAEDYTKAAAEMLNSRWAKTVKNRAIELAEQMANNRWVGV